jgi:hypothetical protein
VWADVATASAILIRVCVGVAIVILTVIHFTVVIILGVITGVSIVILTVIHFTVVIVLGVITIAAIIFVFRHAGILLGRAAIAVFGVPSVICTLEDVGGQIRLDNLFMREGIAEVPPLVTEMAT